MYLLEKPDKSEMVLVSSLDGHDGWTLIGDTYDEPGLYDDYDPSTKTFKLNAKRKKKADRRAGKPDEQLIDELLERFEEATAKIAILEEKVQKLENKN